MFRYLNIIVALFLAHIAFAQKKNGHDIAITIKPYKNTWVYVGNYYGKFKNLTDSVFLDNNSKGVLRGDSTLPQGIYFMVSPVHTILFDFLMDSNQHFSIVADTAQLSSTIVSGSKENTYYSEYSKYINNHGKQIQTLEKQMAAAKDKQDSATIQNKISAESKVFDTYRNTFIKQHPDAMLTAFFQAMQRPIAPKIVGKDSLAPYIYVKEHYWDNVDFSDDRILHTPFFEPKIDEYYKYYVSPSPDSVVKEVNYMLLSAREGKEMYRYLLGKFTDKYINPEIMGQDKVFLFLFNNYFSKGDTTWLNAKQKEFIFNRAYNLMANQIGENAPALSLKDTSGTMQSMAGVDAKYTLVLFWDPECSHCKVIVPEIDSIYFAKWKAKGLKIYAVNTGEESAQAWKSFIREHNLGEWTNVMQTKEERESDAKKQIPNYRQLYDVTQTPTIYLLDDKKRIIAKKLTVQQLDNLIDEKEKAKQ
ncbi:MULTISPECIES: redoxin domain-containing protein [Chitinophagaceae]